MNTTKTSAEVTAFDLLDTKQPTPSQLFGLMQQSVACSDGAFTILAVTSGGVLTLKAA